MKAYESPLIVVTLVGPQGRQAKLSEELRCWFHQRGLRVHLLRSGHEPLVPDCDLVLVPCKEAGVPELAHRIECLWTERWSRWYADLRKASRV